VGIAEREEGGVDAGVISILISYSSVSYRHLHMHSYSSIRDRFEVDDKFAICTNYKITPEWGTITNCKWCKV
jgi:hypothetical protein